MNPSNRKSKTNNPTNRVPKLVTPKGWLNLIGRLKVVTTVPDYVPKTISQQMVIYVDSLSAPTVYRLYVYIPDGVNVWKYTTIV